MVVRCLAPTWALFSVPAQAASYAARLAADPAIRLRVEGAVDGGWLQQHAGNRRGARPATAASSVHQAGGAVGPAVGPADPLRHQQGTRPGSGTQGTGPAAPPPILASLRPWLAERLAALPGGGAPASVAGPFAAPAAAAVCDLTGGPIPAAAACLADWAARHTRAVARGGDQVPDCQWEVLIAYWAMENAGIADLYPRSRVQAEDLVAQAGFSARAARQGPCVAWQHGRGVMRPGVRIPGHSSARPALFTRTALRLTAATKSALGEAASCEERGHHTAGRAAAPAAQAAGHPAADPQQAAPGVGPGPDTGSVGTSGRPGDVAGRADPGRAPAADSAQQGAAGSDPQASTAAGGDHRARGRREGPRRGPPGPGGALAVDARGSAAVPAASGARPADGEARELVVLSLFDGLGAAALAIVSLLRRQGALHRCPRVWTVEPQDRLRDAVGRWWRTERRLHGGPLVEPLAGDPWDLLRGRGGALVPLLRQLPPGSLLLVVAGLPSRQLPPLGREGGAGLSGPDPCLLLLVPILRRLIAAWRPDVAVHAVVANAGATHHRFRDAVLWCLGLGGRPDHAHVVDSGGWSMFGRSGTFFSTLPPAPRADAAGTARRSDPWDEGWHAKGAVMPTITHPRSGPGEAVRYPARAYRPAYLVYGVRWAATPLSAMAAALEALIPDDMRPTWRGLCAGTDGPAAEQRQDALVAWMAGNEAVLGARPPNVRERARGMGVDAYLGGMGIDDYHTARALADAFDPDALAASVGRPLTRWLAGDPVDDVPAPGVSDLAGFFDGLRRQVADEGFVCPDSPFPLDLWAEVPAAETWGAPHGGRYQGPASRVPPASRPAGQGRGAGSARPQSRER